MNVSRGTLALALLLTASPAFANPLGLAVRIERVWREETPLALRKCKLVELDQEWRGDALASIVADYEIGESGLYAIGRFGHRLDAGQNEGAVGVEYRFSLSGCPPSSPAAPPKPKAKRPPKKPCP